ncbi:MULTISPECIES: NAD(P)-dependent oxidoreductase [Kocuria]|uniref:NAD(P)-dependent oxidoreductase n=1 Tax=Kocuria TaxID=57493 RepID=UPI0038507D22
MQGPLDALGGTHELSTQIRGLPRPVRSDQGVLALAPKDALLIDSSTIDVETALELHKAAAEKGFAFVDAPVSGGISGAAAGTLTFMIGGDKDTVARAEQVITPMAGRIVHTGGPGMGQSAKIVNNMMLFVNLEACAEGSVLAAKDVGLALSAGEQTGVDLPAAARSTTRAQTPAPTTSMVAAKTIPETNNTTVV